MSEPEVLQELCEALLFEGTVEDGDVDLVDALEQGVVEDDLEEALADFEPVELDLEGSDLETTPRRERGGDVVVVLLGTLGFEIEEGYKVVGLVADVRELVSFAVEPAIKRGASVVLAEAVEDSACRFTVPKCALRTASTR
ncbi:MAG: hypothetical protein QM757_07955 [Paludibaculum sp.]